MNMSEALQLAKKASEAIEKKERESGDSNPYPYITGRLQALLAIAISKGQQSAIDSINEIITT